MKRVFIWLLCALVLQGCADSTGSSVNMAPAALTYYGGAPMTPAATAVVAVVNELYDRVEG